MMPSNCRPKQSGLSLIELMVALGLGAFIMLGVISVFLSSKASSSAEASLSRIQENGRLAMFLLSADLRKAHYSGCSSVGGIVDPLASGVDWKGVTGYKKTAAGVWAPNPTHVNFTSFKANARPGSDVLDIQLARSMGRDMLAVDVTSADSQATLARNPECQIKKNDLLILSSCLSAHIIKVTNDITCTDPSAQVVVTFDAPGSVEPGYRYGAPTEVMSFENVQWYVGDTGRDIAGQDVYALYRVVNGVSEEMIEGVEYLKIEYGQKVVNNMRFVEANDASLDWEEVSTVRFAVLLQGFDLVRDDVDVEPYDMLGTTISATGSGSHGGGRVIRRVFSTTSTLRNSAYDR